jgi:hypothetical protein
MQSQENAGEIYIDGQKTRERRRWKRFLVDGAYVLVSKPSLFGFGKSSYLTLGPIKNIGMKGLAMHYVEKNNKILRKVDTLSIMFPGEGIIVDKIPFQIVQDFEIADLPGLNGKVRNLCIAFKKVLPMQKAQLERFISQHGNELTV